MSAFSSLLSALQDVSLLPIWIATYGVNQEVIMKQNTSVNQSNALDNRGTPLLIAIELDTAAACSLLLAAGADVNYRHPAKHGNCPLLRAAEMGLKECLTLLLAHPSLDLTALTYEYKLVLGQNIPQYEAGGRSALLLAVEALQPEIVELLLENTEASRQLLDTVDSFDRTPLQAAFEVLALRTDGSVAHSLAEDICRQLSTTTANASANETVKAYAINSEDETNTPSDNTTSTAFDIAAEKYLMTKLMAADCLRERNRVLRSRYLAASQEEVLQERDRGLRAWNDNYLTASRELHTCVYNTSFVAEDILLPSELLTQIPGVYPLDPPPP